MIFYTHDTVNYHSHDVPWQRVTSNWKRPSMTSGQDADNYVLTTLFSFSLPYSAALTFLGTTRWPKEWNRNWWRIRIKIDCLSFDKKSVNFLPLSINPCLARGRQHASSDLSYFNHHFFLYKGVIGQKLVIEAHLVNECDRPKKRTNPLEAHRTVWVLFFFCSCCARSNNVKNK